MNAHGIKKATTGTRFALGGLLSAMAALGCVDQLPTSDKPCPCASGYVCCDSGRCESSQSACDMGPGGAGGHAGTGSGGRGGSGGGGIGGTMGENRVPSEVIAEVAGLWTGYMEGFTFPSGSDKITISIVAPPDDFAQVNVWFGDAAQPLPPTDPNVAWPDENVLSHHTALEGWPYQALDLSYESPRLRFSISRWSPWQDWCFLQTPVPNPNLGWACVAGPARYDNSGQPVVDAQGNCILSTTPPMAVDCAKAFPLCMGTPPMCQCDMNGCHAEDLRATFDIALRNGTGDGSTDLPFGTATNIRLTKTTP